MCLRLHLCFQGSSKRMAAGSLAPSLVLQEDLLRLGAGAMWRLCAAATEIAPSPLPAAGSDRSSSSSSSSSASGPALSTLMVAALEQRRSNALAALEAAMPSGNPTLQHLRQQALPPARRLADTLLEGWLHTSAGQEQQLEAAQAAAARSCAFLRCANLGGGDGPASGEGKGSQRCRWAADGWQAVQQRLCECRGECLLHVVASCVKADGALPLRHPTCSACRAVWYCGTACSHADWREGGHRRVCRALGAARAAEKAARQQAAAAEPGAGGS